jgi:hypothetical protein
LANLVGYFLQKHVCWQSTTQGPTKDRRIVGSPESQNHEHNCHCRTERGSSRYYGGLSRQHPRYHPDLPLGYLHNYAYVVLIRLVRLFYANLEIVQDDDRMMVLQSTVDGHTIIVDPQIISHFIEVPILYISGSLYNEVVTSFSG